MRVLVLAEKKKVADPFVRAMNDKGIKANYLRLLKVSLVSKHKNTLIKAIDENIPKYDAVFLQARLNLEPFIEPLLKELENKGVYVNVLSGSYFIGMNEPYKFVNLAVNNVKTPRTLTSGSGKNIERVAKKVAYPLVAKSFIGKDVQQSMLVQNDSELNKFVGSMKKDVDGFMLKEFIDECVVSCAVIGDKVFAIERKQDNVCVTDLEKGRYYKTSDKERETAIKAASVSGYDIAKVDLVRGHVISVDPIITLEPFKKICSEALEEQIASFYAAKIRERGAKRHISDDLVDLKDALSKTVFGRIFK
jgi:glutathione synthase/RimK-type ligase-like ATP-grasp enzyme